MSQPVDSSCSLILSHNSKHYPISLSLTDPSITALHSATTSALNLSHTTPNTLTYHYYDNEGDKVRMDTTAELVEVMREKAAAGEPVVLLVGTAASKSEAAVLGDLDSDDSDSFVRVEASDWMPSHSRSPSPPSSPPAAPSVNIAAAAAVLSPQATITVDDRKTAEAAPTQPSLTPQPLSATTSSPIPPVAAAQPVVSRAAPQTEIVTQKAGVEAEPKQQPAHIDAQQPLQPLQPPQPSVVGPPLAVPSPPLTASNPSIAPAISRRCTVAQAPAFIKPLVASVHAQLGKAQRVADTVGDRWLSDVQRAAAPRVKKTRGLLMRSMRALWRVLPARPVSRALIARPRVLIVGLVILLAVIGLKVGGKHMRSATHPQYATKWQVHRLDDRLDFITEKGQRLLADNADMAATITALTARLNQSHKRIDDLEQQLHYSNFNINGVTMTISMYKDEVEQLKSDIKQLRAEHTKQPPPSAAAMSDDTWLEGLLQHKAAARSDLGSGLSEFVSQYGDSVEDVVFASVFGPSTDETPQRYESRHQPNKERTKTFTVSSSALWDEPYRYSTSATAASSSPSSAHSCARAGSSHSCSSASPSAASTSSSSHSSSSSFENERKSARAERAERRERKRQEREAANSLWSLTDWADDITSKLEHTTTQPAASTTTARSTSHTNSHTENPSSSHKSEWRSGGSRGKQQTGSGSGSGGGSATKDKKGLKHVGKKIGKALQTVNEAAKRVWKTWKGHW